MKQVITSLQHNLIKHLIKIRNKRCYRYQQKSFLVEGIKPLKEICETTAPKTLIVDENISIPTEIRSENVVLVNSKVMKKLSSVEAPEGIVAEFSMPPHPVFCSGDNILVLDKINDPGNLGTLLRTALAFGWNGVFITENTVDPYNEKVLRAGRGAHFRLPIAIGTIEDLKVLIIEKKWTCLVADTSGDPANTILQKSGLALILSSESLGPSQLLDSYQRITIPMKGDMESLNVAVAGAILMYELKTGYYD